MHDEQEHEDPSRLTRAWIDVKLASLRSEMRLLFVVSVAGNQLLSHLTLSPVLSFLGGGAIFVGGVLKLALFR